MEGLRSFHPDLLALQSSLQLLERTKFVVMPVDLSFTVHSFECVLPPFGRDDAFDGDRFSEVPAPRPDLLLDRFKRFNDVLKTAFAPETKGFENQGHHAAIMTNVFPTHHNLAGEDAATHVHHVIP